jgi:hypothetical protein
MEPLYATINPSLLKNRDVTSADTGRSAQLGDTRQKASIGTGPPVDHEYPLVQADPDVSEIPRRLEEIPAIVDLNGE